MWVKNCWYVAAWDNELGAGEIISRTVLDEPLAIYRAADGALVAMEDRCCHRFAPLSKGRLEGDDLRCMYHGLKFDRTGRCIEIPGQDVIPRTACVRSYPVVEKHSWIWVWMGDPAKAREDLIPSAIGLDDPAWTLGHGQMDYAANYQLINDNLTDFTHLTYVHANSFGASPEFAYTRPNIERLERGIRVWRWVFESASETSALAEKTGAGKVKGDGWQTYDFLAPGILLMHSATYPKGTAEKLGFRPAPMGTEGALRETFTSQAVTPVTDKTSRYFFNWGPRAGDGAAEMAANLMLVAGVAFAEDKAIIEAQQKIIDLDPDRREVLTSADVGPTQFRSVLQRLVRADQEEDAEASSALA